VGPARRQRGWVGLVVVLVALVVVALLAQSALKRYGVAGAPDAKSRAETPIERAKAASDLVTKAAEEQRRRVDDAAR
jgi:Tfp pilus assembly protein PilX